MQQCKEQCHAIYAMGTSSVPGNINTSLFDGVLEWDIASSTIGPLPVEILVQIFAFLPTVQDLLRAQCVNRTWRDMGREKSLWHLRYCQAFTPLSTRKMRYDQAAYKISYEMAPILSNMKSHGPERNVILKGGEDRNSFVHSAKISPDGTTVCTVTFISDEVNIQLWDAFTGEVLCAIPTTSDYDFGAFGAFAPDSKKIAVANFRGNKAYIYEVPTGALWGSFSCTGFGPSQLTSIAWSPDGRMIVTTDMASTGCLWDAITGKRICLLKDWEIATDFYLSASAWQGMRNYSPSFSPDGTMVAIGYRDKIARIWDIDGNLRYTLPDHPATVTQAAFSPDGTMIITRAAKEVRIWNLANSEQPYVQNLYQCEEDDHILFSDFTPDSKAVLLDMNMSHISGLYLWDLATDVPQYCSGSRCLLAGDLLSFSHDGKIIETRRRQNVHITDFKPRSKQRFLQHLEKNGSHVKHLQLKDENFNNVQLKNILSSCPNLEILEFNSVGVTVLDLSSNPKLKNLRCSEAHALTTVRHIESCPFLQEIDIAKTSIRVLSLSNFPHLRRVFCWKASRLQTLEFENCPALKEVCVSGTALSFHRLKELHPLQIYPSEAEIIAEEVD